MRLFLALEIGDELVASLSELLSGPEARWPGLKRVRPEGLHLTVRFFGETGPETLDRLKLEVEAATRRCPASRAACTGLGTFPERGAPRVLFAALAVAPEVIALQSACESLAREAGFPPEARPFVPHVTLGRWRDRATRPPVPVREWPEASFTELVLFRSELQPVEARYTAVSRFELGG